MHAHEAGTLHAEGYRGPAWLRSPLDVNELVRPLWASAVERDADGVLGVAGVSVDTLARDLGTPAYVIDEDDFRSRAREFKRAYEEEFESLGGADVFYAAKAFLCLEVARWVHQEGLNLDVCSGGELAVAIRAGLPGERIGLHGNNKSRAEIEVALRHGVSRIVVDSFDEVERVSSVAAELGVVAPVLVRVTVGVEAHTHEFIATAHEDQKFGLSLAGGQAFEAVQRIVGHDDTMRLLGLHSHIGSQIFDTSGFEISAGRLIGLHARIVTELGVQLPELDLGGGFGMAYTTEHDPLPPRALAVGMARVVEREFRAANLAIPRVSIEPGRAIAGPSTFTLYRVGTVKKVEVAVGASRTYVSVDGGMSDNVRTALYDADYSCTLANRVSPAPPVLARVVGSHCESGDIVVKDEFLPGDIEVGDLLAVPGTGAYCRSLSSQYNHTPRPPVVAVRGGLARAIVRRETIDDILALDL